MTAKLRELEKLKQEAVFSICHEFRTPLTSLTTATMLLETGALTEKQRRWLEIIRLDSEKLLGLPHVFERYHRAHPRREGTGLGLAIVKGIVDAHGGRVWAESQEGQGTTFRVALPVTAAAS